MIFVCKICGSEVLENDDNCGFCKEKLDVSRIPLEEYISYVKGVFERDDNSAEFLKDVTDVAHNVSRTMMSVGLNVLIEKSSDELAEEAEEMMSTLESLLEKYEEKTGLPVYAPEIYIMLGNYHSINNDEDKFLYYMEKAEKMFEVEEETKNILDARKIVYDICGKNYLYKKMYEKAADIYEKSISVDRKRNDNNSMTGTYIALGNVYYNMGKLNDSLKNLENAADMINKHEISGLSDRGILYYNMGKVAFLNNEKEKAIDYYDKSFDYILKDGKDEVAGNLFNEIAESMFINSEFEQARKYLLKSIDIFKKLNKNDIVKKLEENLEVIDDAGSNKKRLTARIIGKMIEQNLPEEEIKKYITEHGMDEDNVQIIYDKFTKIVDEGKMEEFLDSLKDNTPFPQP